MDVPVLVESGVDLDAVQRDLSAYGVWLDPRPVLDPEGSAHQEWADWMAWHTAFAKVRNLDRPPAEREPADLEIDKERAALDGDGDPPGPLYDGRRLLEAYHGPLPEDLKAPGRSLIALTDRLVGTFEGDRYHVRFLVTGHPSIVSPPGFVDGPARDRSFYMAKQALGSAHDANEVVDDDHLTRNDDRLPTCVASAILQAVAYTDTGDPFCEDDGCRLFNPHWQEDLLASMATRDLCEEHAAWAKRLA
jgi:hypothetical protein